MKRKVLSMLLVLTMLLSLVPTTAVGAMAVEGVESAEILSEAAIAEQDTQSGNISEESGMLLELPCYVDECSEESGLSALFNGISSLLSENDVSLGAEGMWTVNATAYSTFAEALSAAGNGDTILLTKSGTDAVVVPENRTVIIDLNGNVLTAAEGYNAIVNYGTLTIQDTSSVTHKWVADANGLWLMNDEATENYYTTTGGVITGGNVQADVTKLGGCIWNNENLILTGGNIVGNRVTAGVKYSAAGGGVYNGNTGVFTMSGGLIAGNLVCGDTQSEGDNIGGGVYNCGGEFTLSGGEISYNTAVGPGENDVEYCYGYGGSVCNTGTFTMTEGIIKNNNAELGGGVYNTGTFTMTEGTIKNNSARQGGGVESNRGNITVSGGSITGNTAYLASGILCPRSYGKTAVFTGGTVSGNNTTAYGAVLVASSNTTIGGNFTVTGNTTSYSGADLYLMNAVTVTVQENFTGSCNIRLFSGRGVFSANAVETVTGFTSDLSAYLIRKTAESKLAVGLYGVTIAETENGTVLADCTEGKDGETVSLTVRSDSGYRLKSIAVKDSAGTEVVVSNNSFTLPADDVTVTAEFEQIPVAQIVGSEAAYSTLQSAIDAAEENQTVQLLADIREDVVIAAEDVLTLNLGGFTLTGKGSNSVVTNNGTLTVTDSAETGKITGGSTGENGGGICNNGTLTLTGGTITGNEAAKGGGVYNGGSLTIGDTAKITGNTQSGGKEANNLYLPAGNTVTVKPGFNGEVGIITETEPTEANSITISGECDGDYSTKFISDSGYAVKYNSGVLKLNAVMTPVEYLYPIYNEGGATKGIASWETGEIGGANTVDQYNLITDSTDITWGKTGETSWYVISGGTAETPLSFVDVTILGEVNIILTDGCHLETIGVENCAGITVSGEGNKLTVYAQSTGDNMGVLTATGCIYCAGIGGNDTGSGSYITINGGAVTAAGGEYGAGIGGGKDGSGSYITINGGTVTANGSNGGAGIGGGYGYETGGEGSNITINGGTVTATAENGAGIGGGYKGAGSEITINGGTVTAKGGNGSAGIGGGSGGDGSNITINGGTVTAAGDGNGAGIGGGEYYSGSYIYINGGTVTATGGDSGVGIGGGGSSIFGSYIYVATKDTNGIELLIYTRSNENAFNVVCTDRKSTTDIADNINKQYVTIKTSPQYLYPEYNEGDLKKGIKEWKTGICTDAYTLITSGSTDAVTWGVADETSWYVISGGTAEEPLSFNGITIAGKVNIILADGCHLTTIGADECAGITVSGEGNKLNVYAQSTGNNMGVLTATGGNEGAGIGGGENITINGGTVNANGGSWGAGIGGGGGNITINGGTVNANGGEYGAGIDGNDDYDSYVTINGGTVNAVGGNEGAGIGGGSCCSGSNITINGGTVTATGGKYGAGIGGGKDGSGSKIYVAENDEKLVIYAGDSEDPETEVCKDRTSDEGILLDISNNPDFKGKQYVIIIAKNKKPVYDEVTYLYPVYNTENKPSDGIASWEEGAIGAENTVGKYTLITSGSTEPVTWGKTGKTSWYVISGGTTNTPISFEGITIAGEVNIILKDGCHMTSTGGSNCAGITISGNANKLNVYAQSTGDNMGVLTATGGTDGAGIGGGNNGVGSNITINGGTVTATGSKGGAGIGGGYHCAGKNITINGGTVTAKGSINGAGIGGGYEATGSYITINGGTVTATGSNGATGIGGAWGGVGSNITINGGMVTAISKGSSSGAGIGGGSYCYGSYITINSGTVIATSEGNGAGIGGGYYGYGGSNSIGGITINGGTVTATSNGGGAGIGGGNSGLGENITINGGTVTATSNNGGAGIGGGSGKSGSSITINSGTVTATSKKGGAGIGGGKNGSGSGITVATRTADCMSYDIKAGADESGAVVVCSDRTSATDISNTLTGQYVQISVNTAAMAEFSYRYADTGGEKLVWNTGKIGGTENTVLRFNYITNGGDEAATWGKTGETSWYVVDGSAEFTKGITLSGDVRIIITDGSSLTATAESDSGTAGICVPQSASLTLYGQNGGNGALIATGAANAFSGGGAGIGGNSAGTCGSITIHGCGVTATGKGGGAGIGGGTFGSGATSTTILGGTVTAKSLGFGGTGIGIGNEGTVGGSITVQQYLDVITGANETSSTEITNNGGDLSKLLNGNKYAVIGVSYLTPVYEDESDVTQGVKQWNTELVPAGFTIVTSSDTEWKADDTNNGFFVVNDDILLSDSETPKSITVSGNVKLILTDGSKLSIVGESGKAGIIVSGTGNSLTVYAQSTDENTMGTLNVQGGSNSAGIGGGYGQSGENVTVNGGIVNATGADYAAGIGGSNGKPGNNITINEGVVTATGGRYAAGIGGGSDGAANNITINGGTVTAIAGAAGEDDIYSASGIGAGYDGYNDNGSVKSASGVKIYKYLKTRADGNNPPETLIANSGDDLANSLAKKRYVNIAFLQCAQITYGELTTQYPAVSLAIEAAAKLGDDVTIKLIADVTEDITIPSGQSVTIDLNGFVFGGTGTGSVIDNAGTLTICDSNASGQVHYFTVDADGVWNLNEKAAGKADYTFCNGILKKNNTETDEIPTTGAVIAVIGGCITGGIGNEGSSTGSGIVSSGKLKLLGGNIVGNSSDSTGGGIFVTNIGSLTMEGGSILGNNAFYGAGVCTYGGPVTISGGVISYNNASVVESGEAIGFGGGVFVFPDSDSPILGGTAVIVHNSAEICGNDLCLMSVENSYEATVAIGTGASGNGVAVPGEGMNVNVTPVDNECNVIRGKFATSAKASDADYFHFTESNLYKVQFNNAGTEDDTTDDYLELTWSDDCNWYTEHTIGDYIISNISELEALANIVNSGIDDFNEDTVKLSYDFENKNSKGEPAALTTPIGYYTENSIPGDDLCFKGKFDGNGKNVELNISGVEFAGLFGCACGNYIMNVSVSGTVSASGTGITGAGGIAGKSDAMIVNCSSTATISASGGTENNAGGLAAVSNKDAYIWNCYSCGNVTASGTGTNNAGGIVGKSCDECINCYESGTVIATGGTNHAGGVAGYCVNPSQLANCYILCHDDADNTKDINVGLNAYGACLPENSTYAPINCVAVDIDQLTACSGTTDESWVAITVYSANSNFESALEGYETPKKVSVSDALSDIATEINDVLSGIINVSCFGVMNENVNNGMPILLLNTPVILYAGKAYSDSECEIKIAMPEGITYDNGTYTFTNVCLPSCGENCLTIADYTAVTVNLVGSNQLGAKANTDTDDNIYTANYGIYSWGEALTVTGSGTLTTYSLFGGIQSDEALTFGKNFTGVYNANDYAKTGCCCLSSSEIIISGGTFNLNNKNTCGIGGNKITINGGTINVRGGYAAIEAEGSLTITGMFIFGANEPYVSGTTNTLTNKTGTEYVTLIEGGYEVELVSDYVSGKALVLVYSDLNPETGHFNYNGVPMTAIDNSDAGTKYTFNSANGVKHSPESSGKYVYAIIVDNSEDVKLTVSGIDALVAYEGGAVETVLSFAGSAQYDVNGTGKTDLNDAVVAQTVYNVHSAYFGTNINIYMSALLKADVNRSKSVDTADVIAILANYTK